MSINESQFRALLDRYIKGKTTEEESKILDDFFNAYRAEAELAQSSDLSEDDKREILLKINERIASNSAVIPSRPWALWLKAAAAISFICLAYFIYSAKFSQDNRNDQVVAVKVLTEKTNKGEKLSFDLPDGTRVHLNANSTLSYPAVFSEMRTATLTGEAYFEVKHDKQHPFRVTTSSSTVEVLGTSFNVKTEESKNASHVTLVNGKVVVQSNSQRQQLSPGYQAAIEQGRISTQKVDVQRYVSWKDDVLYFEGTRVADAVTMMENWYNTEIELSPALRECLVTGQYKKESLQNVLKSFELILNAKVDYTDLKNIRIEGTGCKKP